MKRKAAILLAILMALTCFAGCQGGSGEATTAATAATTAATSTTASTTAAASTTGAQTDDSFSFEGYSGSLVIYSANESEISEEMANLFSELTGIKCEILYAGGGELMARIAAEASNPLGDIITGVTGEVMVPYAEYLEPYSVSVDPSLLASEPGPGNIYAPGGGNILIFMVNKNLVSEEDYPRTWTDLTNEKFRGQIAFCDPSAASSAYLQLNTMYQLYGWDFVREFYNNLDGKFVNGSATVPKATSDGEYMVGVTIENYGADYLAADAPVAVIYPEDGTMMTIGGSAIIKGAKNLENAKAYIEFTCTQEYSQICAKYNRRGARVDVPLSDALPKLSEIFFFGYDYDLASDRETMLEGWNDILVGR